MRGAASSSAIRSQLETALGHHRCGQIKDAKRIYEKLLRLYPGQPDAMHFLGVAALDEQDFKTAVRLISQAVAGAPANATAHCHLGNALKASGRHDEARKSYETAIKLSPQFALAHLNLGVLYNDLGQTDGAIRAFGAAIGQDPTLVEAYLGLGRAHAAAGQYERQERALRKALELKPGEATARQLLVTALARNGAFEECRRLIASILADQPQSLSALCSCARAQYIMQEYSQAADLYRQAAGVEGAPAQAWNDLGRTERVLGNLDEAARCFEQALALDPGSWDARRNLALLRKTEADAGALADLVSRRGSGAISPWDEVLSGFTLGELFDRQGDHDGAFAQYAKANSRLKSLNAARGLAFDHGALRRRVDALVAAPPAVLSKLASPSDLPVFIVGMPRSGTSLVEQILASHSAVFGAGERKALGAFKTAHDAGSLSAAEVEDYLAAWVGDRPGVERALDKMPDNVFLLDTAAALLPNARVIYCDRNPCDLILSCYFQLFQDGNAFSADLLDTAGQFVQVTRLKSHWAKVFGDRFTSVSYETLVGDLESESRRLVDFLGLPWQAGCLDFHRTQRPVATASGWQVRQPLYATSVDRWRRYQRHLGEVQAVLAGSGIESGT